MSLCFLYRFKNNNLYLFYGGSSDIYFFKFKELAMFNFLKKIKEG